MATVKSKYLRCQTRGCQNYQLIHKKNYTYVNINGRLRLGNCQPREVNCGIRI